MARSIWKLPYFHSCFFRLQIFKRSRPLLTMSRSSQISNKLRQKRIGIYNGKSFRLVRIRPEMLLCRFGEFSMTRRVASGLEMHVIKKKRRK